MKSSKSQFLHLTQNGILSFVEDANQRGYVCDQKKLMLKSFFMLVKNRIEAGLSQDTFERSIKV